MNDKSAQSFASKAKLETWFVVAILVGVALFTAIDIHNDLAEGATWLHLLAEGTVAALSLVGAFLLWRRTLGLRDEVLQQKEINEIALQEAEKWRTEASQALQGLSDAIDSQLSRWQLSKSEKEVALLLLKGLSLKEIAEIRGVSEKTARTQSFAIYGKSGLGGRAELSAFFLEDLMLPQDFGEKSSHPLT
jgi:DNA-binding CsgD family transcriptional regulator